MPEGRVRAILLDRASKRAVRLFDLAYGEYLPALNIGGYASARLILGNKMLPVCRVYRAQIDKAVELARQLNVVQERKAADPGRISQRVLPLSWLLAAGALW